MVKKVFDQKNMGEKWVMNFSVNSKKCQIFTVFQLVI